jgi:hypothetical protein
MFCRPSQVYEKDFFMAKRLLLKAQSVIPASGIILFAVILRLIPHPPNFAPIAALALFGGVYLDKKYALLVPLIALFFSDMFLGFYAGMGAVYGSFFLTGCIGLWIKHHKRVTTIIGGACFSSLLFFMLTNFNYWYSDAYYPKTMAGLLDSYISALPFFRNTVLGDLFYTGVFFGSYEIVIRFVKQHTQKKIEAVKRNNRTH